MPEAPLAAPDLPFAVECAPPFLTVRFAAPQRTLGWSLLFPGFAVVREVVWVEVRNSDLGLATDAHGFLKARVAQSGLPEALAFMTSRDIRRHHFSRRRVEGIAAACLTTVGLSNGERVGARKAYGLPHAGTINTLVHVSVPLGDGALVEALSIAAEARTAAIIDSWRAARGPAVTGTGTDCIVVASPCRASPYGACPHGGEPLAFAGLHTAVGEAIGGAVYHATLAGAEQWDRDFPHQPPSAARPQS